MAKAQFHKNQRVYVKPVGTWALIEHVVPHWAKGLDEPHPVFITMSGWGANSPPTKCRAEEPLTNASPTATSTGAWSAHATNGSPQRIARAIRCPAPIRWW